TGHRCLPFPTRIESLLLRIRWSSAYAHRFPYTGKTFHFLFSQCAALGKVLVSFIRPPQCAGTEVRSLDEVRFFVAMPSLTEYVERGHRVEPGRTSQLTKPLLMPAHYCALRSGTTLLRSGWSMDSNRRAHFSSAS